MSDNWLHCQQKMTVNDFLSKEFPGGRSFIGIFDGHLVFNQNWGTESYPPIALMRQIVTECMIGNISLEGQKFQSLEDLLPIADSISSLKLSNTPNLPTETLNAQISAFTNLKTLSLASTNRAGLSVTSLPGSLFHLDLSNCGINGSEMDALANHLDQSNKVNGRLITTGNSTISDMTAKNNLLAKKWSIT